MAQYRADGRPCIPLPSVQGLSREIDVGRGGKKGVLRGRGISWGETQKRTEGSQTLSEELFQFGEHGTVMPFAMSFCILACFPRRIDRERGKLYSLFRVRRGLQQSCK